MRIMVFFDLPTLTSNDMKEYRRFRKFLITNGFLMMQESVYCRLAINQSAAAMVAQKVRKHKPQEGLVQMLIVTERQFSRMENLVGEEKDNIIQTDERLVIL